MIVDSSAIVAIVLGEPEAPRFITVMTLAANRRMSVANYVEAAIVLESRAGKAGATGLDRLLDEANIELVPVTIEQGRAARKTWRRYGKGNHPAALNFGDCFAYVLAEATNEPLLYKGDDFARTGITSA